MEQTVPAAAVRAQRAKFDFSLPPSRAILALAAGAMLLAACSSTSLGPVRAPVVDKSGGQHQTDATAPAAATPPPGQENAGKPGYYTVRPGDTLIRIGLETGQNWRDLARWNGLENANLIEVGQVVRVVPPTAATPVPGAANGAVASAPVTSAGVQPRSLSATAVPPAGATASTSAASATPASAPASASAPAASASAAGEAISFAWPSNGTILDRFDESRNKGVDIAGKAGDPVLAAADGRVVYAGSGLRGYGNLIILKHNNTYLTAYAHNQTLLVKEDQNVRQGQKIAEMGNSDADRVKLHFEVRRQGKPVDPLKHLPAR